MSEPTKEQYAMFGEAVAGILDGYTFDSEDHTEEDRNAALAYTVQLAALAFGITPEERPHE